MLTSSDAIEASELSRAKRWDELPLVSDDMLHTIATVWTYDEIAAKLNERYGGRVDRIEFSTPVVDSGDAATLKKILPEIS